jgi:hypothetical protein
VRKVRVTAAVGGGRAGAFIELIKSKTTRLLHGLLMLCSLLACVRVGRVANASMAVAWAVSLLGIMPPMDQTLRRRAAQTIAQLQRTSSSALLSGVSAGLSSTARACVTGMSSAAAAHGSLQRGHEAHVL